MDVRKWSLSRVVRDGLERGYSFGAGEADGRMELTTVRFAGASYETQTDCICVAGVRIECPVVAIDGAKAAPHARSANA